MQLLAVIGRMSPLGCMGICKMGHLMLVIVCCVIITSSSLG